LTVLRAKYFQSLTENSSMLSPASLAALTILAYLQLAD